jgi:diguanylate cyclase (GGDEF)-like protein
VRAIAKLRRAFAGHSDRPLRRWPWVLAVVAVALGSMIGRSHLAAHRDAVAHGAWEAATFAQNAHSTVHALTTVSAAVPPERWREAIGPLLAERDQAARGQLILLRSLAGKDRRLETLEVELSAIAADMGATRADPDAERRVTASAVRLGRVAGSLARDLRARDRSLRRTILLWQAGLIAVAVVLVLWLFRAFQGVLLREATSHATHLRHLADHDPLTGLGNRRKLERDLERRIASASPKKPLQVLLCDLDGFKAYNDARGHAAGDELLARVAARIADAADRHGAAYRLGGDEFCVLWCGGEDLAPELEAAVAGDGDTAQVSGSVGSVWAPDEASDGREALRLADARMYAAKAAGRPAQARLVHARAA